MKGQTPDRVRRVSVTDPIGAARRYDYADAFELRLEGPDSCSPEEWVRAGVEATPGWIKRIAGHADGLGSARVRRDPPPADGAGGRGGGLRQGDRSGDAVLERS